MFDRLRSARNERQRAKAQEEFDRAADASDPALAHDDRRARDLPDSLGDFNETDRMGPIIGGTGANPGRSGRAYAAIARRSSSARPSRFSRRSKSPAHREPRSMPDCQRTVADSPSSARTSTASSR